MHAPRTTRVPAAVVLLLALGACGSSGATARSEGPGGASSDGRTVTVFAAASLAEAFEQVARDFEQANPGTSVTLNLGGSSALAQQVVAGAPADVFAAASPATMRTVVDSGDAVAPEVFARNTLQIAVPSDDPGDVTGLADFADDELTLALCAEQVPCGAAAQEVFAAAGITPAPDTLEQDVKAALSKVRLGEVDAALVYETDVRAAGDEVVGISFPEARGAVNDYEIAALSGAPDAGAAAAFVAHVLSEDGQRVLAQAGFARP